MHSSALVSSRRLFPRLSSRLLGGRALIAGITSALVFVSAPAFAEKVNFQSTFDGLSSGSKVTGTGNFTFDSDTKRFCGKVTFGALETGPATGAALKNAADQKLVKALPATASPLSVDVTLSVTEAAVLGTGMYMVVATAAHSVDNDGEINGEIKPGGPGEACPAAASDAGTDSGTSSSSSSSSSSSGSSGTSSSSSSSSGSSGDPPPNEEPAPAAEEGGCSTTGESTGHGLGFLMLAGLAAVFVARSRRR